MASDMAQRRSRESPESAADGAPGSPRSRVARIIGEFLPVKRARRLLAVSFIDSLGTGMFLSGSALFFTRDLGLTAGQVGLGLSLAGVAGFLCSVPTGRLSDRIGALPMLIGLQLWRAACFVAYPFAGGLGSFIAVSCLAGAGEWAANPVVGSLIGSLVPPASRVRTMSIMTVLRNIGFTVGAGLATAAIALGGAAVYRGLVFADAASFLVSAALLPWAAPLRRSADVDSPTQAPRPRVRPNARYVALSALNGVLYLHTVVLGIGLPLWIATRTHGPVALIGATVVVNTVLAVVLQTWLSRGVDGVTAAAWRQARAGVVLAACCLLVAVTGSTSPVITIVLVLLATGALTAGEVFQSIGAWGVSYGLAPDASRGYYLSVYSLGSTAAVIVGPWLITAAVLPAGALGWAGLAVAIAVSGALVPMVARGPS